MSKPLIIKCNRMFPDNIIKAYRQDFIREKNEDGVIVLPPGFELAEVNVELLEKIKAEIEDKSYMRIISGFGIDKKHRAIDIEDVCRIIDMHISELKGE